MNPIKLIGGIPQFLVQMVAAGLRGNESPLAAALRRRLHGGNCHIDTAVVVVNRRSFRAGPRSALYHGAYILNTHGQFTLGHDSHLGAGCYVNVHRGCVTIGDNVAIGPGTKIIAYSNHYRAGSLVSGERITADVVIGNNVFLGADCVLLPGATIADNVVVGAGSVVKGALQPDAIYAGTPARLLRRGWFSGETTPS